MRKQSVLFQSPDLDGHFIVLECWMSQHFGTAESYAQANIQGSPNPQPNEVWWIQSEEDTGNGVVRRGCWNWGTDFAHLSHMAEHAQRGQLSLNKHNHFLLVAHKAFKQKPVRHSSPGHLGERTASRQNIASPVWLSVCRHPGKAQTWSCFSTPPHTPLLQHLYREYIRSFAYGQKPRQL